jgi:hypothetical protein
MVLEELLKSVAGSIYKNLGGTLEVTIILTEPKTPGVVIYSVGAQKITPEYIRDNIIHTINSGNMVEVKT